MNEYKMLIGGKWVCADGGRTFETINPTTMERIARMPKAGESDVCKAVAAARAAFPAWSKKTQAQRNEVMNNIAAKIRENAYELAMCETREHGTPCSDAVCFVMGAAEKFEYSASIALSLMGVHIPMEKGTLSYLRREPFGVTALIIPWNLPIIMTAVKMSAAIAVGNTCVIKPPSINSMTVLKLAEIIQSAGVPDGVVNVITGGGEEAGKALCCHPDVDIIGFTGSSETGKNVLSYASGTVKKCIMELGGKNPAVIFPDADLDAAVRALGTRQFNNSGQHCSGPGRYYVHEKVYDAFLEKYAAFAGSVKVGDPTEKDTFMGPVVGVSHKRDIEEYILGAVKEGARIYYTQEKSELHKNGCFVMPTIVSDCRHDMTIAREEVFGPVAVIIRYSDEDDILALANDSRYGLCAHLWSRDTNKCLRMAEDLHAGSVYINSQTLTNEQPWGTSVKESGLGKEGGLVGMMEFTELKMVTVGYGENSPVSG